MTHMDHIYSMIILRCFFDILAAAKRSLLTFIILKTEDKIFFKNPPFLFNGSYMVCNDMRVNK